MSTPRITRIATTRVHDMIAEGLLSAETVIRECLAYMSEADVEDMARSAGWLDDDESDDDEDDDDDENEGGEE